MSWSESQEIRHDADHTVLSNYTNANASWFQKSWWSTYDWAWIYTNDTDMSLKITKAAFNACAGHSNGKRYNGSYEGDIARFITYGYGCTFTSDLYALDASGKLVGSCKGIGNCKVESISEFNCAYGGVPGNVCTNAPWTSFGNPQYFTGNRAWHPIPIAYDTTKSPAVPPGGHLIVVIRATRWETSQDNALLVMRRYSSDFTAEFEPENTDYIWVCEKKQGDAQPKWYKERKAFQMTNRGWKEMEAN